MKQLPEKLRHLLVAERDEGLQRIISLLLKKEAYKVSTASSGDEIVSKIVAFKDSDAPIDLLVVDLNLKKDPFLQTIEELCAADLALPLIALVPYGCEEKIDRLARERFALQISMPFHASELVAGIDRIFGHLK